MQILRRFPDLLTQKLWGWGHKSGLQQALQVLSSLRTTDLEISSSGWEQQGLGVRLAWISIPTPRTSEVTLGKSPHFMTLSFLGGKMEANDVYIH